MTWGLTIVLVLLVLFVFALLTLGEGLLKVAASQSGAEASDYSVIPKLGSIFGKAKKKPKYVPDGAQIKHLTRGFDINLVGAAVALSGVKNVRLSRYSLKPTDIIGMSPIPKVVPEIGMHVKAGEPLFFDKKRPEIIYAAPISGEIIDIRRGEKRSIAEIVILADKTELSHHKYDNLPSLSAPRQELLSFLLGSGAWPFIRQRPFDTVAEHTDTPKAIFVSTFDTAPLAPDLNLAVEGRESAWLKGLEVLARLSGSKVHVGLSAKSENGPNAAFIKSSTVEGVETHWFDGPHPAGNVGIQMHHIDAVLPGTKAWYTDVHGVILIGTLFLKGIFDTQKVVAITGAELKPHYVKVHQGACLDQLLKDMPNDFSEELVWTKDEKGVKIQQATKVRKTRIVSGDVLSGTQVERKDSLGFYDDQITVLKEGNYYEMFGWLVPQTGHPTLSQTFPAAAIFSDINYTADTNTNGEKRAFVMTGEYESVLPMDIYPQHVFRAIMSNDIEKMEGLGLLELSEEDIALCEFACTSKQPLQKMLREGLEMLRTS